MTYNAAAGAANAQRLIDYILHQEGSATETNLTKYATQYLGIEPHETNLVLQYLGQQGFITVTVDFEE